MMSWQPVKQMISTQRTDKVSPAKLCQNILVHKWLGQIG